MAKREMQNTSGGFSSRGTNFGGGKTSLSHDCRIPHVRQMVAVSILTGVVSFGLLCSLVFVIGGSQQVAIQNELLTEFEVEVEVQTTHIERTLRAVSVNLRLAGKAVEMLPFNASSAQVFPILATSAGLMDDSGQFTETPPLGVVTFLQHMIQPHTKNRMETIAADRGVDLNTFQAVEVVESGLYSQRVQPLNLSSPDIYMITHASSLPLTYNQTQLQRSGVFLTDFSSEPNHRHIIEVALENNSVTSRTPFFVPAGFTAIPVLAPVYFNEWSNDDPIASETNYRGVVVQTLRNETLARTLNMGFPIWFQLRDIEMNEPFITSRSDAVPIRDVEVDSEPLRAVRRISAFSRTYEVEVFPTQRLLDEFTEAFHYPWTLYLGIVAGLVFSFLLGCVVYVLLRRASSKRSMAKLAEELRNEKKLAEAENRIHEQVLGYIHHEIRNPLNIIMGTADLILSTIQKYSGARNSSGVHRAFTFQPTSQSSSDYSARSAANLVDQNTEGSGIRDATFSQWDYEEVVEELGLLKAAGLQMEQHVNDMLDLQRLRRRELTLNPLPCDIVGCLQSIINFYSSQARVPLSLEVVTEMPGIVVLDEGRIRQIITNGLTNAMAHTSNGSITISVAMLRGTTAKDELSTAQRKMRDRSRNEATVHTRYRKDVQTTSFSSLQALESPEIVRIPGGVQTQQDDHDVALRLTIRDTGSGLGGANVDSLFKSFTSVKQTSDGTLTSDPHNSGLGLSICGLLVDSMGGGVDLRDLGNGCEFSCVIPIEVREVDGLQSRKALGNTIADEKSTLPLNRGALLSGSSATVGQQSGNHPNPARTISFQTLIMEDRARPQQCCVSHKTDEPESEGKNAQSRALVIDDDPTNVKLVSRMLKLQGVQSHGISTGNIPEMVEEALRRAGHLDSPPESGVEPFNFVLLDIRLGPTLSGVDILRELKPRLRGGLPVFAMTANTRKTDILEYKSTGFSGLLSKPVSRKKVSEMLMYMSKGRQEHSFWLLNSS